MQTLFKIYKNEEQRNRIVKFFRYSGIAGITAMVTESLLIWINTF